MKSKKLSSCVLVIAALFNIPFVAQACDGRPILNTTLKKTVAMMLVSDTVPPKPKAPDSHAATPVEEVIKGVPKARNQAVPIPVTIPIKPVIIIKPKIIKPVIKILH